MKHSRKLNLTGGLAVVYFIGGSVAVMAFIYLGIATEVLTKKDIKVAFIVWLLAFSVAFYPLLWPLLKYRNESRVVYARLPDSIRRTTSRSAISVVLYEFDNWYINQDKENISQKNAEKILNSFASNISNVELNDLDPEIVKCIVAYRIGLG